MTLKSIHLFIKLIITVLYENGWLKIQIAKNNMYNLKIDTLENYFQNERLFSHFNNHFAVLMFLNWFGNNVKGTCVFQMWNWHIQDVINMCHSFRTKTNIPHSHMCNSGFRVYKFNAIIFELNITCTNVDYITKYHSVVAFPLFQNRTSIAFHVIRLDMR